MALFMSHDSKKKQRHHTKHQQPFISWAADCVTSSEIKTSNGRLVKATSGATRWGISRDPTVLSYVPPAFLHHCCRFLLQFLRPYSS
jgi:hypothetical protein